MMTERLLDRSRWPEMPAPHRAFLDAALPVLVSDARFLGLAAGGSFASGSLDEFSDLDLIVVHDPQVVLDVRRDGERLAAGLGTLLAAFTAEHVGEPRMLICLYGPSLLHVDLKFLTPDELAPRVEDPVVLWDRDSRVRTGMALGAASHPTPDLQWIEDRFWVWVHYLAVKIARGELLEAIDGLTFMRGRVLGPLSLLEAGARPNGVRRLERLAPERATAMSRTLGGVDAKACMNGLAETVRLYLDLRERLAPASLVRRASAERAVMPLIRDP